MRLSQIPAPAVAGCVREMTTRAAIAEIKNCYYDGADMIDLHITGENIVVDGGRTLGTGRD